MNDLEKGPEKGVLDNNLTYGTALAGLVALAATGVELIANSGFDSSDDTDKLGLYGVATGAGLLAIAGYNALKEKITSRRNGQD